MKDHDDPALTVRQAAKLLGVHEETVRRLARRGEIPSFKVGRSWRFRREVLLRWADDQAEVEVEVEVETGAKRILIIDDNEPLCRGLARLLKRLGFEPHWALQGQAGLRLAHELAPHAILLDLMMPGMDGATFIARLREHHPTLPVIIITGHPQGDLMLRAMQHPPVLLLAKPVAREQLERTLNAILSQARSSAAEPGTIRHG